MTNRLRSEAESDEYTHVYYVAVPPRKRDWLRILRGKYTPTVRRVERLTFKGNDRLLRQTWTREAIHAQLYNANPFSAFEAAPTSEPPTHGTHASTSDSTHA